MKTNLKLTKVTISKLDNLNFKPLENEVLQNLKGGFMFTGVDIITIGGGWNDTTHLSSCQFEYDDDGNYTNCISRES